MERLAEASLRGQSKRAKRKEGARATTTSEKDEGPDKNKKRIKRSWPAQSLVVLKLPQAKNILSLKVLTALLCAAPPLPTLSLSPLSLMSLPPSFLFPPASCPGLTQVGKAGERMFTHALLCLKTSERKTGRWIIHWSSLHTQVKVKVFMQHT